MCFIFGLNPQSLNIIKALLNSPNWKSGKVRSLKLSALARWLKTPSISKFLGIDFKKLGKSSIVTP